MKRQRISTPRTGSILVLLMSLTLAACSESAQQDGKGADGIDLSNAKAGSKHPQEPPRQNSGVIKTVQTAGAYTYLQVDIDGSDFWLATMATPLQAGQKISWRDYAMMRNFDSKALGRRFEQILFVDRIFTQAATVDTLQRGVVEESMSAAGYVFIRVDHDGNSIWLAAPETIIRVGQQISWSGGAPMRNFISRSLDREFDEILFVGAVHGS